MKAKWTPGPLTVRDESRMEEERVIYKPGPSFSIYSNGHDGKGNGRVLWATATEITSRADATLYALAPEMVELIEHFIRWQNGPTNGNPFIAAQKLLARLEVEK